jgi:K+-sensing histidine kinase KdpD
LAACCKETVNTNLYTVFMGFPVLFGIDYPLHYFLMLKAPKPAFVLPSQATLLALLYGACVALLAAALYLGHRQALLSGVVALAVALPLSHLTLVLRRKAALGREREQRALALFHLSQELSAALILEQVSDMAVRHLDKAFNAQAALLLADRADRLDLAPLSDIAEGIKLSAGVVAETVYEHACNDEGAEPVRSFAGLHYLPLRAPMRTRGVLVIRMADGASPMSLEQSRLLQTFAAQIALAIERIHYVDVARETEIAMESERLRNSLLSAVSHDIRTPLTAIVGLSSTLASHPDLAATGLQEHARAIEVAALKMNSLVTNLLDMARLQAGAVRLHREWQMIEEVIGSALGQLGPALDVLEIDIDIAPALPLVWFDAVLVERVLCNLLDNALKYAAGGKLICVSARQHGAMLELSVEDHGPGVAAGQEQRIFDKFVRGAKESNKAGVGLGLAICAAIVESHGGKIGVNPGAAGGARFAFTLPLGTPPADGAFDSGQDLAGEAAGEGP